jgi:hypothetical protein
LARSFTSVSTIGSLDLLFESLFFVRWLNSHKPKHHTLFRQI